jgi:Flp pilus assembly pilin Flp
VYLPWSIRAVSAFIAARLRVRTERGANLVEYLLLLTLIALLVIIVLQGFAGRVREHYESGSSALS